MLAVDPSGKLFLTLCGFHGNRRDFPKSESLKIRCPIAVENMVYTWVKVDGTSPIVVESSRLSYW